MKSMSRQGMNKADKERAVGRRIWEGTSTGSHRLSYLVNITTPNPNFRKIFKTKKFISNILEILYNLKKF